MDRRKFIKQGVSAGFATSLGYAGFFPAVARSNKSIASGYDLVAIRGGEPDKLFDKGIASLGGMESFVKKGQKVVVKPNIGWDSTPERAADTNPLLVKRIVEHCYEAGASEVFVFDHTCDNWTRCYKNSQIESYARDAGAKIAAGNLESYYQEVELTGTKVLKTVKVHELILDSDVFINVPVLKHHTSSKLTICMKNLMGIVWDRHFWHRNNLHQCIAEFPLFKKPDLNIVDCYGVIKRNGPRGVSKNDVVYLKTQIISRDILAADVAATRFFGEDPDNINYIKIAGEMNVGTKNLDELNINRIVL